MSRDKQIEAMELNREQVVKALERCASGNRCYKCPYDTNSQLSVEGCMAEKMRDAIALVKELSEENERLSAEKEAGNKELFHKWKTLADETADRFEGLYQDAKSTLVADTARKMQELLSNRIENRFSYHGWYLKETVIPEVAKEIMEGG